jgi:hypothetical protein
MVLINIMVGTIHIGGLIIRTHHFISLWNTKGWLVATEEGALVGASLKTSQ